MIDKLLGDLYWNEMDQLIATAFNGKSEMTYLEITRIGDISLSTSINYILEETSQTLESKKSWTEDNIKDLVFNNLKLLRDVFLDEAINYSNNFSINDLEKIQLETNLQVLYDLYNESYRFDSM